jgi:hypothetical protein
MLLRFLRPFSFGQPKVEPNPPGRYQIPSYPCYGAIASKSKEIDVRQYFSGEADWSQVRFFETAQGVVDALKTAICYPGYSYVLCFRQGFSEVTELVRRGEERALIFLWMQQLLFVIMCQPIKKNVRCRLLRLKLLEGLP